MKQFLITVAGVLVGLILFLIVAPLVIIGQVSGALQEAAAGAQPRKDAIVLTVDLRGGVSDQPEMSGFAVFGDAGLSTVDIVRKLQAASTDTRVKGIYMRAPASGFPAAAAEEVRAALAAFKASGKFVVAHLQNEGITQSVAGYAVAAVATELYLDPGAELPPIGFSVSRTYLADALKRFSIDADVEAREEYKSAADALKSSTMSPAERENINSLFGDIYGRLLELIAQDRGLSVADAKRAIEATPLAPEAAVEKKLVTKLGRPVDAETTALDQAGGEKAAELFPLENYRAPPQQGPRDGPAIALIYAQGEIVGADSDDAGGLFDDVAISAGVVTRQIEEAAANEDVKAIVIRVSSPGGSALASDQIGHAIDMAQKQGKKVVISMGPVAASGGYWMAAGADAIYAQPTTITGSIGVVYGRIMLGRALEKNFSIRTDRLTFGSPVTEIATADRPLVGNERRYLTDAIQRIYDRFLLRVKDGRGFATVEEARAVAKGRVWTGRQALERKLVDGLGGLTDALNRAKELGGMKADDRVRLIIYPERPSPIEALSRLFGASAETAKTMAIVSAFVGDAEVNAALDGLAAQRRRNGAVRAETAAWTLQ